MFALTSNITIGSFSFSGVHEVHIEASIHTAMNTAKIKLPAVAYVNKGAGIKGPVITGDQFKEGDPVTILLGYNGDMKEEFRGFVKSRNKNMPLEVVCEGYTWLLKRNDVRISQQNITLKDLLAAAVKGIDSKYTIKVKCDVELVLVNVQLTGCGMDVIALIKQYTDGALTCFFTEPDVLWCGYLMDPIAKGKDVFSLGKVSYRPGWNIFRNNTLKRRTIADDPLQVMYSKKQAGGATDSKTSDAFKKFARTHSRLLNQVKNAAALKELANEKALSTNYTGYEGAVETFLQPFVTPGYMAQLYDTTLKDSKGVYLVESVETIFGMHGARRKVELGAQQGFAKQ